MMCRVRQITTDAATHMARVDIAPRHAPDMTGTLRVVQRLDPHVEQIDVYAGGEPDVRYRLSDGAWTAWRLVWATRSESGAPEPGRRR
jgi:hypothetical protein